MAVIFFCAGDSPRRCSVARPPRNRASGRVTEACRLKPTKLKWNIWVASQPGFFNNREDKRSASGFDVLYAHVIYLISFGRNGNERRPLLAIIDFTTVVVRHYRWLV